tara:strand:+ start:124 stop:306 length:183 start_codon:yes stop_codon:yes gene_type:complete
MSRTIEERRGENQKILNPNPIDADCPICGGRGYTVEKYGEDIEYNGCILCYANRNAGDLN